MSFLQRAQRSGKHYLNPVPTPMAGFSMMFKVLPRYLSNKAESVPKQPLGPFHTNASLYAAEPETGLRVTWFGHSSTLLEIDGVRVLIDPIWEQRTNMVQWAGPKRFFAPTLRLAELPRIDIVLISHDHYDHLGRHTVASLAELQPWARWVTAKGVGRRLIGFGANPEKITELDWTDHVAIQSSTGASCTVQMAPSRHFSGRGLHDRFTTLWGSYILSGSKHKVFYGADSGTWPGFAEIGAAYGPFDLTMLEIGAYDPLWAAIHLGPDAAVEAYHALGGPERAGLFMPVHWGLFNLALHAWDQPIQRLTEIAQQQGVPLWSPRPGEPTEVAGPLQNLWWRRE